MKKLSVLAAVLLFAGSMSLTSCKHDCVCTTKVDGTTIGTTTTKTSEKCSTLESSTTAGGSTTSVTCE